MFRSGIMEMAGRGSCVLRMLWFIQTPRRTSTAWYPWWAAEAVRALATIREAERVPPTGWRKPSLGFQGMAALAFVLVPNMMAILVPLSDWLCILGKKSYEGGGEKLRPFS